MLSSMIKSMAAAQAVEGDLNPREHKRRRGNAPGASYAGGKIESNPLHFRFDDLERFEGSPVPFQKPVHICDVSRDSKGKYHSDASELLKFDPPKKNCDLNLGYDTWTHKELGRAELTFEPVMRAVSDAVAKGMPKPKVNYVMWRGNVTKLLCGAYGGNEDWEMSVYCKNNVLYFDSRETPSCQRRKTSMDAQQRLYTYYGYKFEHYCTGVDDSVPVDTNPGANYNAVRRIAIGDLRLLICGEVDCYSAEPARENFMELKTSKLIDGNDRARRSFERYKLMKFWAQSFSIGVPRVVVGFRDDAGVVRKVQRFYTLKIPTLLKGRERAMWDYRVCINFMHQLLRWVDSRVRGTKEPWLLRYNGKKSTYIELKRNAPRKDFHKFDEKLYDAVDPYKAPE
eukprot:g1124.t1